MREWIDFTRNQVTFRERREENPPVDRCVFDWMCRIDGTLVDGTFEVSHIIMKYSNVDYRELISKRIWAEADHIVNGDKREIERRRQYEEWRRKGINSFA